ncbi:MAG: sigma-70 family RNA polymerase sigma factor [Nannocystaceae bacterium]|nr:sigma-70 family RNA polymerase sigma factor [Nannocystaceae bacterium]
MSTLAVKAPVRDEVWVALVDEVRRAIARRVSDEATIDDLVQDVFVRVQSRRDQLREDERLGAWVGRISRSVIADHYRRTKPLASLPPQLASDPVDDVVQTTCLAGWVATSLKTLDEKYRVVLEVTELQGLTQRQAATQLGLSLSAVKSRVLRGRAKLAARLHACCEVQLDRRGGVVDYSGRPGCCS